jgi:DNA-binding transcriptional LysR family regulator
MAYTLRQLTYAVAVAERGSITEAAIRQGISQPAISAAIKDLETEFGVSIFLRQPARKIVLTPAGQRFIARARQMLEEAAEFESEARGLSRFLEGSIEVGCFLPTAPFIMPLVMKSMDERYPGIDIHLNEGYLNELNQGLKSGEIEVALMYDQQPDRQVEFEPLLEAPPYVLLSADDPLAKEKAVTLEALSEREMVLLDLPVTEQYFHNLFFAIGLRPVISYRAKSYEMVRSLVASGIGYSILIMRPANTRAYGGGRLAYRPIADPISPPHYGLAMAKDYIPTRIVRAFVDECRRVLQQEDAAAKFFVRLDDTN